MIYFFCDVDMYNVSYLSLCNKWCILQHIQYYGTKLIQPFAHLCTTNLISTKIYTILRHISAIYDVLHMYMIVFIHEVNWE